MRIMFITTGYPSQGLPQYCVFLEQQALGLQHLGHTVEVYHLTEQGKDADEYVFHEVQVFCRKIHKRKTKFDTLYPTRLSIEDENNLEKILERKYDVASFHFGGLDCLNSAQRLCNQIQLPLVLHFHGLNIWRDCFDPHPWLTTFHSILKKKTYKKLSGVVCVSNVVKHEFQSRVTTIPTYTVYNGVDCGRFKENTNRHYFQNGIVRILCVANLIPLKGQKYLIEASSILSKRGYNIEIAFAGRGPDETALKELAMQKEVKARFVGYLPYEEISLLMLESDIFVMPSFYEALGCVYLEAMSAGMITVGVKGQGIEEVIVDGENGFLVEPKSIDSIVTVINNILQMDRKKLGIISSKARDTSLSLTWDASAKSLEAVYEEIILGEI